MGVIDFSFSAPNHSSNTIAQPVAEMSIGRFMGIKRGRRVRLTTLQPSMKKIGRNM
jgi:hypothetical protein